MVITKNRKISGEISIMLDSLRVIAAVTVLIYHAHYQWITNNSSLVKRWADLGHGAVIIFFVLSGYLIAYTTSNNRGPMQYAIARLSRLYSVLIPALLLTAIINLIIIKIDPYLAGYYSRGNPFERYILCIFFCNEISLLSAAPPINSPLWSLSYEFWYYVIFGIWFYKISEWKYKLLFIACCFIVLPKIILLMPIWIFGYYAYRSPKKNISINWSWFFVFLLLAAASITFIYLPPFPRSLGLKPLFFSNQFVNDWIGGLLFSLALWHLPYAGRALNKRLVKFMRIIADLSFPLYILHYPLLILWRATFGWQANNLVQMWQAIIFVSIATILIGLFLENRRFIWVNFFSLVMNKIKLAHLKFTERLLN